MKKFSMLLLGLIASTMPLWASQTTFDFSKIKAPTATTDTSCSVTQDGFTLTINAPASKCFVGDTALHMPLKASLTVTQKDGRHINLWAVDASRGVSKTDEKWSAYQFVTPGQLGFFAPGDSAQASIQGWGNDWSAYGFNGGDYKTTNGYLYVINLYSTAPTFTFNNQNYGKVTTHWDQNTGTNVIDEAYFIFNKLTVRDDDISTDIVNRAGVYMNFKWVINNEIVPVAYKDGVLYCRSLDYSKQPQVTNKDKLPYGPGQHEENYTNYDWIALNLVGEIKDWFDSHNEKVFLDHVIKAGSVMGRYCDYVANHSYYKSYLNPTMNISVMPEFTGDVQYTTRNVYYVLNLNKQDDFFFMPPKRNEVADFKYVLRDYSSYVLNPPYQYKGKELYGHAYIDYEGQNDLIPQVSFPKIKGANLPDAIVLMGYFPASSYSWNFQNNTHNEANPNFNHQVEMEIPPFYQDNVERMYYNVYDNYALMISCKLVKYNQINILPTGVADVATAKQVQSVTYVNLQGQQSQQPMSGVNIKLTRYTDGTTHSEKIITK